MARGALAGPPFFWGEHPRDEALEALAVLLPGLRVGPGAMPWAIQARLFGRMPMKRRAIRCARFIKAERSTLGWLPCGNIHMLRLRFWSNNDTKVSGLIPIVKL